jgi:hypothetical protein
MREAFEAAFPVLSDLAKTLRRCTDYPWRDCIEAASRTDDFDEACESLPSIWRERYGLIWHGETVRVRGCV